MRTSADPATPRRRHWRTTIRAAGACNDARKWLRDQPDPVTAWNSCERGDWLLWIAARVITNPQQRMIVVLAACDCAETALAYAPAGEDRPRQCIETVRAWTRGEATIEQLREKRADAAAAYAAAAAADADAAAAYAAAAYADADAAADAADAYAAADARTAHLQKLAAIVRNRIPLDVIRAAFRAAQKGPRS